MPLARLPSQAEEVACSSRERTPALQPQFSWGFFIVRSRGTLIRGDSCIALIPSSCPVERRCCSPFFSSPHLASPRKLILPGHPRNPPPAKLWMRWDEACEFLPRRRASFLLRR